MSKESELIRLENFVSKLLKNYQDLKAENGRLVQQLHERDETIVNLQELLTENDSERNEMGSRVNKIIESIEEWETLLDDADGEGDIPANDSSRQGSLFSPAVEEEQEIEE